MKRQLTEFRDQWRKTTPQARLGYVMVLAACAVTATGGFLIERGER